jgi:hypothetical protein
VFPNPQDALPLPPSPNLDQYKKRAKDLHKASQSPDPAAIRTWATHWINSLIRLSDLTLTPQLPVRVGHWVDQLDQFARKELPQTTWGRTHSSVPPSEARRSATATLAAAQFIIARALGFESWPKLAKHLEATARANSPVNHFEQAADAIVTGDVVTLERLLRENPDLIRARSTRRHQATLLHYVSANGVEGYRQKTPKNIVEVGELILRAGADVNATADVYSGSSTLALVATSLHPERAGVQDALLQLLLEHGAALDSSAGLIVNACLANGRLHAAEFLASRGARVDLEAAAGLGRLDLVQSFFDDSGAAPATTTNPQKERALLRACEYGRTPVVDFLLQHGVPLHAQADSGQSALHCSVIGGHLETIKLLLERGASLEDKNVYGGTALAQALWSAVHSDRGCEYLPVIDTLLKAGARIEAGTLKWLTEQTDALSLVREPIAELLRQHGASS